MPKAVDDAKTDEPPEVKLDDIQAKSNTESTPRVTSSGSGPSDRDSGSTKGDYLKPVKTLPPVKTQSDNKPRSGTIQSDTAAVIYQEIPGSPLRTSSSSNDITSHGRTASGTSDKSISFLKDSFSGSDIHLNNSFSRVFPAVKQTKNAKKARPTVGEAKESAKVDTPDETSKKPDEEPVHEPVIVKPPLVISNGEDIRHRKLPRVPIDTSAAGYYNVYGGMGRTKGAQGNILPDMPSVTTNQRDSGSLREKGPVYEDIPFDKKRASGNENKPPASKKKGTVEHRTFIVLHVLMFQKTDIF